MSAPVPFLNKGLVQKVDPAQLSPGEFYQAENIWSQQEGSLSIRTGHKTLTRGNLAAACVSISKLNLAGDDVNNPRYVGCGTGIYRNNPTYTPSLVKGSLSNGTRWSAQQYNAGSSGVPALYFATVDASMRDNGSYATLQKWGIDPPPIPVVATTNVPEFFYLTVPPGPPRFVPSVNSDASGVKTVSAFQSGIGYVKITPTPGVVGPDHTNGVNGIYVGMLLTIKDAVAGDEPIVVMAVTPTAFYTVTTIAHSAVNVTLSGVQETLTTVASTTSTFWYNGFVLDASFNGIPENGYDTDDTFHISLRSTDVTNVTQIEIRIVPNYSGAGGASTDYYSFILVPASMMSAGSATSPAWLELNVPKNVFSKVGNAGSGAFTWKNINEIDIIATANANGGAQTVGNAGVYFIGGGGLNSSAAGTTQYDWRYAYRNPNTKAVGNPSVEMISDNLPPPLTNGKVTLTLTGTAQAATDANGIADISGPGSIAIYRRGGTFSDGLYRLVGRVANPGSGATVPFIDNASDQSLDQAEILEFDNDPPVVSALPIPLTANIANFQPSGGGGSTSTNTANTTARLILSTFPTNFPAGNIGTVISVGSTVQVGLGVTGETSIVQSAGVSGAGAYIECFLQYSHNTTANDQSETIEINSVIRGKCDLVHQDFDCLFLAGDPNNPATLYQSKVGRPESFPVLNFENNFVQQANVGSPSNPINGVTSIGPGELVCLNLNNIFIVQVWAGQMQQPIQAPASRGLYSKWCWCKGDNRIWYLAYDGIYTWAGGTGQKVSNSIDYMFKKQAVNGIAPIDYTKSLKFSFSYAENSLYATIIDTNGVYKRLRYETIHDRWTVEVIYATATGTEACSIDATFVEPDTGNFLVSVTTPASLNPASQSYLWLADFASSTDGWKNSPTDGIPIQYTAWRYWPIGDPTADYQVGEIIFEMMNPRDDVTAKLYYNYSTTALNTILISGGSVAQRGRFWATVNSTVTEVQYSIGLKLTGSTGSAGLSTFYTFAWRDFPWSDSGYPGPKVFGWLDIQVNTNGVNVPMQLEIDGSSAFSFNVNGTFFARANTITLPANIVGTQWRVVPTQGYQGMLQLYGVTPKYERQPIGITHWTSLIQVFGYEGYKFIWQIWVDYVAPQGLTISVYRDRSTLFFQKSLPAHTTRSVERFYLPDVFTPSGGTPQFNKSISYEFTLDSLGKFQLYRDGSRVEIRQLSSDQRAGFEQKVIWEMMPLES